jgi:hypothetical protein
MPKSHHAPKIQPTIWFPERYGGIELNISLDPLRNSNKKRHTPNNHIPTYQTKARGNDPFFDIFLRKKIIPTMLIM